MEPLPEILVWEEIVLPQPPATDDPVHWLGWLGLVLLLLATALWLFYRNRPRQRAKRTIKQLRKRIRKEPDNTRQHLYELRECLRGAFGNAGLAHCAQGVRPQSHWCEYLQQLARHCFSPTPPSEETVTTLTERAWQWLKKARP